MNVHVPKAPATTVSGGVMNAVPDPAPASAGVASRRHAHATPSVTTLARHAPRARARLRFGNTRGFPLRIGCCGMGLESMGGFAALFR